MNSDGKKNYLLFEAGFVWSLDWRHVITYRSDAKGIRLHRKKFKGFYGTLDTTLEGGRNGTDYWAPKLP